MYIAATILQLENWGLLRLNDLFKATYSTPQNQFFSRAELDQSPGTFHSEIVSHQKRSYNDKQLKHQTYIFSSFFLSSTKRFLKYFGIV